jgi:hypothetical protein
MTTVVAAFSGSLFGVVIGCIAMWHLYLKPRLRRSARAARAARLAAASARPSASQPTATTRGFVQHSNDVIVGTVGFGRVKKATRL